MRTRQIPGTDLRPSVLCLGANVFGWTADEADSFAVLDAFVDAGGTFIDTADSYMGAALGTDGGESEAVIGRWMASRGARDRVVLATKVGMAPRLSGLAPDTIRDAVELSLKRLGTDRIDLYWAHVDDPDTPLEETLGAFDELVRSSAVGAIGASNHGAPRLAEALAVARREGLASYVALQPHYNLLERDYERDLAPAAAEHGLVTMPYYGLAKGFLTGKYRSGAALPDGPRASGAAAYLDERGVAVLGVLDEISADRGVPQAAVALAWLAAQPTVLSPIASARSVEQLEALLPVGELELADDELVRLGAASY